MTGVLRARGGVSAENFASSQLQQSERATRAQRQQRAPRACKPGNISLKKGMHGCTVWGQQSPLGAALQAALHTDCVGPPPHCCLPPPAPAACCSACIAASSPVDASSRRSSTVSKPSDPP